MWTAPQIETKSSSSRLATLSRQRPVRQGKGETGVGDMIGRKGERQEGGEGRRKKSRRYKTVLQLQWL
jgi:hypothetical protein